MKSSTTDRVIQMMLYYGCQADRSTLAAVLADQAEWSVADIVDLDQQTPDMRLDILLHSDLLTYTQLRQFACGCASRILHQEALFGRPPDPDLFHAILLARRSAHEPDLACNLAQEARALCQPVEARLDAEFQEQDTEAAAQACEAVKHIRSVTHSPAHQAASSLAWASYGSLIPDYKLWQLQHLKELVSWEDNTCPTCSAEGVPIARCVHCGATWCPKCFDAPDFEPRHGCKCGGYYTVACGRCGSAEPGPYWLFECLLVGLPTHATFTMCSSCANDYAYEHPDILSGIPI
jgi:hypothetical protein